MTVGIELGSAIEEIGAPDFFHAFFSTISGNLEPDGWGSRFPALINELYRGELAQRDASLALTELEIVRRELAGLPVDRLIWDIEDRTRAPPWGNRIAETITDLSNYFVTSTGRDLIDALHEVFESLRDRGGVAKVIVF